MNILKAGILSFVLIASTYVSAGSQTILVSDLKTPIKVRQLVSGDLLVTEGGDETPNSGRLSLVSLSGQKSVIIEGLPSGLSLAGPQGPAGFTFLNNQKRIRLAISTGDTTVRDDAGDEISNPLGPTSPILSSILTINFSVPISDIQSSFTLELEEQYDIAFGKNIVLTNTEGDKAVLKLFFDFPNTVRSLRTGRVLRSNAFGIAQVGADVFVTDSSRDALTEIGIASRAPLRVVDFPRLPLPQGGEIDAVLAGIARFKGNLLIALETGFPSVVGLSKIVRYNTQTGNVTPFITGLTQAVDVLPVQTTQGFSFYVVELTTDSNTFAPGRLLFFADRHATPVILSDTLNSPTSVARDPNSGILYVTEALGNIVAVTH